MVRSRCVVDHDFAHALFALQSRIGLPGLVQGKTWVVEHGVVDQHVYAQVPPRAEYELTDFDQSLRDILEQMQSWGGLFKPGSKPPRLPLRDLMCASDPIRSLSLSARHC